MSSVSREHVEAKLREYKELIRSIHENSSRRRQNSQPVMPRSSRRHISCAPSARRAPSRATRKPDSPVAEPPISFQVSGIGLLPIGRLCGKLSSRSLDSLSSSSKTSSNMQPPPALIPLTRRTNESSSVNLRMYNK
jgi:hypothetical protein